MKVRIILKDETTPGNTLTLSNCEDETLAALTFYDNEHSDDVEGTVIIKIEDLKHALRKLGAK